MGELTPASRKDRTRSWWGGIPEVVKQIAALLTAVAAIIGALAAIGVIGGGDTHQAGVTTRSNGGLQSADGLPTVVRFEGREKDYSEHGFFTPRGFIVSTQYARAASDFTVLWTFDGRDEEARVELVERGGRETPGVVLLRLVRVQPPPANYTIRNAQSLRKAESVTALLGPSQLTPGKVVDPRARRTIPGYGMLSNLILTTSLGRPGEGGAPLVDARGRLIGMLFADGQDRTVSIPIEDIRAQFPDAF